MDIFKMANQIAGGLSSDDKEALEGMDMEAMIGHVTKNVFSMMGNGGANGLGAGMGGMGMGGDILSSMLKNAMAGQSPNPGQSSVPGGKTNYNQKQPRFQMESPGPGPEIGLELDSGSESDNETETIYPKTRDICFELNVDLEDFYTGKKKKLNVKRKRMTIGTDGKQTIIEEKKKLIIPIERGMKDEQQIRFEGEADQIPGYRPGDIVITLVENEHPFFERDSDNLIIVKNINLYTNYDITFDIKHLDGNVIRVCKDSLDALHLNDSIRKIKGLGMPSYKKPGQFGDLFVRFNLVIPKSLSLEKLNKLKEIFEDSQEVLSESFDKKLTLEHISESDISDLDDSEYESESESDSGSSVSDTDSSISDSD